MGNEREKEENEKEKEKNKKVQKEDRKVEKENRKVERGQSFLDLTVDTESKEQREPSPRPSIETFNDDEKEINKEGQLSPWLNLCETPRSVKAR